jgi:hypothetical protein
MAAPERPNNEVIGHFTLTVPSKPLESDYVGPRSALFVPTDKLLGVGFEQSDIHDVVVATRDVDGLLTSVSENREVEVIVKAIVYCRANGVLGIGVKFKYCCS